MVVDDARGGALRTDRIDLFALDAEGVVQCRVAVDLGPLPARKTGVKIFDVPDIACGKVGRILLNDVMACGGGETAHAGRLERTQTETKAGIPFDG